MRLVLKKDILLIIMILLLFIILSVAISRMLNNYVFGLIFFISFCIPVFLIQGNLLKDSYLMPLAIIIFGGLCLIFFGFNKKIFLLFVLYLSVYLIGSKSDNNK